MLAVAADWEISKEKVVCMVTDNSANIVKAITLAFVKGKSICCFAHTLNLVSKEAIQATPDLSELINKFKCIVTFFKHSVNASDEWKSHNRLEKTFH